MGGRANEFEIRENPAGGRRNPGRLERPLDSGFGKDADFDAEVQRAKARRADTGNERRRLFLFQNRESLLRQEQAGKAVRAFHNQGKRKDSRPPIFAHRRKGRKTHPKGNSKRSARGAQGRKRLKKTLAKRGGLWYIFTTTNKQQTDTSVKLSVYFYAPLVLR